MYFEMRDLLPIYFINLLLLLYERCDNTPLIKLIEQLVRAIYANIKIYRIAISLGTVSDNSM